MILDPDSLLFAQHRATTWELFAPDWLAVGIERFPHYRYLQGDAAAYKRYLKASWRKVDVRAGVSRLGRMRSVPSAELAEPITVCRRGDGWLVVDGNHRAALRAFRGEEITATEITAQEYAERIIANPGSRWGTKPGKPYQTIELDGVSIPGRRCLDDRHGLIWSEDLRGRSVLDLGCNLGMASHYAHRMGARDVEGWEADWGVATSAVRLAVLAGVPIEFRYVDVGVAEPVERDTCLAFAVHEHADITRAVRGCGVLYLETHRDAEPPALLRHGRTTTLIGHTDAGRRRLYRMPRRA